MLDGFLNIYSDLVGGIPFFGATDCSGISAKVLFQVNVECPFTGKCGTRSVIMAYTFCFLCDAVRSHFILGRQISWLEKHITNKIYFLSISWEAKRHADSRSYRHHLRCNRFLLNLWQIKHDTDIINMFRYVKIHAPFVIKLCCKNLVCKNTFQTYCITLRLRSLKQKGIIERIDSDSKGYWKISE